MMKRTMMMMAMASFSWTMVAGCVGSWRCLVVIAAGVEAWFVTVGMRWIRIGGIERFVGTNFGCSMLWFKFRNYGVVSFVFCIFRGA
jgi:hypothetical protein